LLVSLVPEVCRLQCVEFRLAPLRCCAGTNMQGKINLHMAKDYFFPTRRPPHGETR
jgi:hypothetical protein